MRHLGRPGFGDGYLVNVELTGSPKVKMCISETFCHSFDGGAWYSFSLGYEVINAACPVSYLLR